MSYKSTEVKKAALLFLAAAGLAAGAAQADPFWNEASYGSTATPFTTTVNLDQFNPADGVLSGISFLFTGVAEVAFTANEGDVSAITVGNLFTYTLPDGRTVSQLITTLFDQCKASACDRMFQGSTSFVLPDSSEFSLYQGTGTFSIGVNAQRAGDLATAAYEQIENRAGGSIRVTYDVPEPGSLALLALGCLTLGLARRRTA
jgi:hypothetical protein